MLVRQGIQPQSLTCEASCVQEQQRRQQRAAVKRAASVRSDHPDNIVIQNTVGGPASCSFMRSLSPHGRTIRNATKLETGVTIGSVSARLTLNHLCTGVRRYCLNGCNCTVR